MLDVNNDIEYSLEAEEVEDFAMTSLGRLVFADIHNRQNTKSVTSDDSSVEVIDFLSLAFENLFHMPFNIIENYSTTLCTLDISNNMFNRNFQFLSEFDNLTSLNLDRNNVDSYTILPYMSKLELLWLNHNKIDRLYPFLKNLYERVPNLKYLSLMGNIAAPSYLNGGTFYEYLQYRLYVISWFPNLVHLDDRTVTEQEQQEAKRMFKRPCFECIAEEASLGKCFQPLRNIIKNIFPKPSIPEEQRTRTDSNSSKGFNSIV